MRIHSRVAGAFFALIVGLPLAFAQNAAPVPRPEQSDGKNNPAIHHRMHQGPMANRGERGTGMECRGQCRRMGMRCRAHRHFMLAKMLSNPSLRERLGVTPEQAQKIRTQTFDFRKTQIRNRAELQVKHLELHELLLADNPDRAAIDNKLQEISAIQLAGMKSAIDFRLAMRAALTPDQRQKLLQMRKEFFRHAGPGHERPRGPRGDAPFGEHGE